MTSHLEREIENLKKRILSVSAMVEESLLKAVRSLVKRDAPLAKEVIESDRQVDLLEVEVEEECLKILALHQPVASDLRFIIAVMKINNDLERIADLAVNIAERALSLTAREPVELPAQVLQMAQITQTILKQSIDSLINLDRELANAVCRGDDEVDDLLSAMYSLIQNRIKSDPDQLGTWISLLTVSRYLERIADHATNVAEDVLYMINGKICRHKS